MKKPSLFFRSLLLVSFFLLVARTETKAQDSRSWATYLGGVNDDYAYAVATDASGNVYLTGYTVSTNGIATPGSHKETYNQGAPDVFLIKFDSLGNRLWGTYYGGTGDDQAKGIAVDQNTGDVYIAGVTQSSSGIASGGFDNLINEGATDKTDAFLVKFNSSGVVQWGTYYGGAGIDEGHSVAVDALGNVYLAGQTSSATTTQIGSGGHQNSLGGSTDAFLVKFDANGNRRWGTYYGGADYERGRGVTVGDSFHVYLAGFTPSTTGIASLGAYKTVPDGADAFVAKFDSAGTRLWGTYFGGNGTDECHSVAVDKSGHVYLAGVTLSTSGFATPGAFQTTYQSNNTSTFGDAYLAKFDDNGTSLQWATYYGGANNELIAKVAVDAAEDIYLAGQTDSKGLSSGGFQNTIGGGTDAFLAKFAPDGTTRYSATYYGGTLGECANSVSLAPDNFGNVYMAGETSSSAGIASGGYQNTFGGANFDAFLVKFGAAPAACTGVAISSNPKDSAVCSGARATFKVSATGSPSPTYQWKRNGANINGATANSYTIQVAAITDTGSYTVMVKNDCDSTTSTGARLTVNEALIPHIGTPDSILCFGDSTQLCTQTVFITYEWNNGETSQCFYVGSSGAYSVSTTDANGCSAVSGSLNITVNPLPTVSITVTNDTLQATAASTYQWYLEGNLIGGAINQIYIATQNGYYTVEISDANGCSATSANFYYDISATQELENTSGLVLVPNPVSSDRVQLILSSSVADKRFTVYNELGQIVHSGVLNGTKTWIDIAQFNSGLYFIKAAGQTAKLVKQ
ncbi:MAG: SBBP repeat-containing protein [Bacteroidetes bacterium]|nr:SBBP repeat-containing protein [Bacteroidota bacterium]